MDKEIWALLDPTQKPFYFGVASGDPHQHSVIIWTKALNENGQPIDVHWQVATDTLLQNIVAWGKTRTTDSSAYTVKITVKDLQPNTAYFYRFQSDSVFSPIGRTKTTPVQTDKLRFALVSCSNYSHGFFNAYRLIAERNDINAVIHLGDYIYERATNQPDGKKVIRTHIPAHEILTLQDYRSRYAQYRLDKDLQEVHRLHPFITQWDDHEFANDTYKDGAENHQSNEGSWDVRKANAKQAYFEWLPITDNSQEKITRHISFGNLADLFMLDERVEARAKQGATPDDPAIELPAQTMLGKEQCAWLIDGIKKSSARWKLMANQVVFSALDGHHVSKKHRFNQDAWDGYPTERKEIFDSLYANNIKNLLVLTGDFHSSWAFDLVQNPKDKNRYNRKTGEGVIGAEFVTPSVTSNGLAEKYSKAFSRIAAVAIKNKFVNPHLRFVNLIYHGYLLLSLTNNKAECDWVFCKTIRKKTDDFFVKDKWESNYNNNKLVKLKK